MSGFCKVVLEIFDQIAHGNTIMANNCNKKITNHNLTFTSKVLIYGIYLFTSAFTSLYLTCHVNVDIVCRHNGIGNAYTTV